MHLKRGAAALLPTRDPLPAAVPGAHAWQWNTLLCCLSWQPVSRRVAREGSLCWIVTRRLQSCSDLRAGMQLHQVCCVGSITCGLSFYRHVCMVAVQWPRRWVAMVRLQSANFLKVPGGAPAMLAALWHGHHPKRSDKEAAAGNICDLPSVGAHACWLTCGMPPSPRAMLRGSSLWGPAPLGAARPACWAAWPSSAAGRRGARSWACPLTSLTS